ISPLVMARTPRASRMPAATDHVSSERSDGWLFVVATVIPAAAAISSAVLFWVDVRGLGASTNHHWSDVPAGDMPSRRSACSVTTTLGAAVPFGSLLDSWMTG